MGLDVYSKLFLGIRVTRAEFYQKTGTIIQCHNKHIPADPEQKFCSICGKPFEERDVFMPTPLLQKLNSEDLSEIDDDDDNYYDCGSNNPLDNLVFNGKRLLFQQVQQTIDYDPKVFAIGFYLLQTDSHRSRRDGCCSMPAEDFRKRLETIEALRESVGFTDRPVELFASTYLSY